MSLRARIAVLLSLWVVVMPASSVLAQQRPASRGPGGDAAARPTFHAESAEHLVRGRNGVEIATTTGHYHQDGVSVRGGQLSAAAPWGEQMSVRYIAGQDGFLAEINDRISTLTRVDEIGNPVEYVVRVDDQEVVIDLLAQSRRLARGGPAIQPWERQGYEMVIGALLEEQSADFWKSLGEIHTAAPAGTGCVAETALCVQAILSWIGSLSALISICGATAASGGVLAPGCLLTIITHPTVTAATAIACGELAECLTEEPPHGDCGT
jgi:hypothetical protein